MTTTYNQILQAVPDALLRTHIPELGERMEGKVRDIYLQDGQRVLITTDRVSAFDQVLGAIPFKGQVLNQLSAWWFEQTANIVANHVIAVPDPNVTIGAEAAALPVEVIVRGFITGVTSTSLWTLYEQGVDRPYGLDLPSGLRKNDPLPEPVITPTTKATGGAHDERLTSEEVVEHGLVEPDLWAEVQQAALTVFELGQQIAATAGLVLVDTKYEFGLLDGKLALIDEIHTPDSSRYWIADSLGSGDPLNYDKEFLRLWFIEHGYRGDGPAPTMPAEFIAQVAGRYINAYERLTGNGFEPGDQPAEARIRKALL